jgi:outer membrane autotransporter protein
MFSLSRLAAVAAMTIVACQSGTAFAQSSDEVEKKIREEVSRRVSDAVANRIGDQLVTGDVPAAEAPEPNSAWITTSYSSITSDDSSLVEELGAKFQTDLVNVTFGADHRFGESVFVGLSGAYAAADTKFEMTDFDFETDLESDSFTVSPYGAYVFHPNFFASGLFSYTYSDASSEDDFTGETDSDSQTFSTELAMNSVATVAEDVILKGKVGWRFNYTELLDFEQPGDDDVHSHALVANAEAGYDLDWIIPYVGVQYEHVWPEKFFDDDGDELDQGDTDYVFLSVGARGRIGDSMQLGASVRTELLNDETNQIGGAAEFRIRF